MAPGMPRAEVAGKEFRDAGVLILIYPLEEQFHLVLIKRTEYEGAHSRQVSLPGGMYEPEDRIIERTALREAAEETGLNASEVMVAGMLTPLYIPVSRIMVHTFVGMLDQRPDFRHDPDEVEYLIETRVESLMHKDCRKTRTMILDGKDVEIPYYDVDGEQVWGATAMILSEFLEVAAEIVKCDE
jgi:8-oxo-dGTP pyrophosphatase MutT (NUDIX family)